MSENPRLDNWLKQYEESKYDKDDVVVSKRNEVGKPTQVNAVNYVSINNVHYTPSSTQSYEYVGFWRRFFAFFIDSIILSLLYFITDNFAVHLAVSLLYYSGLSSSPMQATIGKAAIGAIVVDEKGKRISFLHALGRYFAHLISGVLFFIGFIMIGFHGKKKGLHDLVCGTMVVNRK